MPSIDNNNGKQAQRVERLCRHFFAAPAQKASGSAGVESLRVAGANGTALQGEYDFIVVGSGSSGSVVAARLSENPAVKVLLIEAGAHNDTMAVRSPVAHCASLQKSELDWQFETVPQEHMHNRVSFWPRGKTFGGCSSLNYMLYVRGDPRTYNMWASEMGCPEWGYDQLLPYFIKSENYVDSTHDSKDTSVHGTGGPLTVTNMASPDCTSQVRDVLQSVVTAGREQGIGHNEDYNGPTQQGMSFAQVTVKDGVRHDAANAFLVHDGAEKRPNLTIIANTMVTKVVMQGNQAVGVMVKQKNVPLCDERKTAAGVQSMRDTPTVFIGAGKEVVMSAGAVCTPWLLMLSGVGPQEHLNDVGVPLVKDLPVGESMQDHLFWGTTFEGKEGVGFNAKPSLAGLPDMITGAFDWLVRGTGIFYYPMCHVLAFFRSGLQDTKWGNDCEFHIVPFSDTDRAQLERNSGLSAPTNQPSNSIAILPTLLCPQSKGTIRLKSSDPLEYPLVDPKYFSDPIDIEVCVQAHKKARETAKHEASKRGSFLTGVETVLPEIAHLGQETDEYIREFVKHRAVTVYHPTSTCKMGPVEDPSTVVDTRLRVHGLKGLRVVDASVFPTVPTGNTNAPCIMLAERAVDMIREDWGL